MAYYFTKRECN